MTMEEATVYSKRPLNFFYSDIVDKMFKRFVGDLISIARFQRRSWEKPSEEQVREWVENLRWFTEPYNYQTREPIGPDSLDWKMYRATTELQKEIDKYFDEK